jgi:uncharacterized protein YbbC (DUF1343 family)
MTLHPFARLGLMARGFVVVAMTSAVGVADGLERNALAKMDVEIHQAIAEGKLPGGVLWLEHQGQRYFKAYGERAVEPEFEPMTRDTIFDAASLTKVVATAPAAMILIERGQLKLDEPVSTYLPTFTGEGKDAITLRHLMTHTSGLRPGLPGRPEWSGYAKAIELACAEKTTNGPGTSFRYSDINYLVLGEVIRRVSGTNLDAFATREIFRPLKMINTSFLPPAAKRARIAPTQKVNGEILRGVVHDPTARRMGGVAGHAGLFTTATDLARFARMMLNGGELDGVRLFKPETVRLMTHVQSPEGVPARRGLGWDIDSSYSRPRGEVFPLGSYGHTGFTGTSIWIDPFSETFWIFLSNRVHPDGKGNILDLQKTLGTLAARAVEDFDFSYVPGSLPPRPPDKSTNGPPASARALSYEVAGVLNGIDVLERQKFAPLKGLKIGLITNQTGRNRQRYPTIDLLLNAPGVQLKALFSPEHGLYGLADEPVGDSIDERTGLPVFSLYGKRRAPGPEQLRGLDALVFDLQDIGCRFYTYISTMGLALEAAGRTRIKFFVLDRVNPINGLSIDGPVLTGQTSFVAYHPIPVRHGMTVGELAQMFKSERQLDVDLAVIRLEGWSRKMWFDETALPWANPSPNMRSATEAILYPGVGLLETTALSVGRGTGTPFEVVGAPYLHDVLLAAELNKAGLIGVRFVPVRFTPTDYVYKGQSCAGVNIILTDRARCNVVDIGITIAQTLHRLHPEQFGLDQFNRLLGHQETIAALDAGKSLEEIRGLWTADLASFKQRRAQFLLYE